MIKYFSQILSKFSVKQRITALIILSIVLVIITLGPIIIKTLDPGTKELKTRIDNQDKEIIRLNKNMDSANIKIYTLNQTIIQNQEECTNRVIEREKEISKMIDKLIKKSIEPKYSYTPKKMVSFNNINKFDSLPKVAAYIPETNNTLISDLILLQGKITEH